MTRAESVIPADWARPRRPDVLFDNGTYSVVAGYYQNRRAIGERWNGEEGTVGFPSQGGNPLWHVVPEWLHAPILHGLIDELARNPQRQTPEGMMSPTDTANARRHRIFDTIAARVQPTGAASS